jgi:iron complex outermembrane recepter protein
VTVTRSGENAIQVSVTGEKAVPVVQVVPRSTATPPTAQVEEEDEVEVVVTGERPNNAPNASVGTRANAPLRDVPQSIQVIPRQVLEDQNITDLTEALRNVSGVSVTDGQITIRGFFSTDNVLDDGFANRLGSGRNVVFDSNNVEQIEVLKGPASVLFGGGLPGGTVNITAKQPLERPSYELETTIGSFRFYRPTLDLTGPLNDDKTILYRLTAAYQNSGSFVDFARSESFSIFPTLSFRLGKDTKLTLEGKYESTSEIPATGLPNEGVVLPNVFGRIPRSRFLTEPDFDRNNFTSSYVGYRLEHQLSDSWALRNRFRASFNDNSLYQIFLEDLDTDQRTVIRSANFLKVNNTNYALKTEVLGKIQTGIIQHDLLFGVDLERNINDRRQSLNAEIASIDLFEPRYGALPGTLTLPKGTLDISNTIGLFAQDLLSIGEHVKILIGGRFDFFNNNFTDRDTDTSSSSEETAFSPRIGIVYQPIKQVSIYAGWSRSFEPVFGEVDRLGNRFVPVTGDQVEVGVKTELFDNKLAATLSAYQITRQNDFQPDPVDPDNFRIQVGEQQSKGIEFDLSGEPLPGLRLIASYAYTDARITKDNNGLAGKQQSGVPQQSASLSAIYEIQDGDLKGLGFGPTLFFVGDRPGDSENTFIIPSYLRTDALVYYKRDNWKIQLNIKNLFDVVYFEGNGNYAAPFEIQGTISVKF